MQWLEGLLRCIRMQSQLPFCQAVGLPSLALSVSFSFSHVQTPCVRPHGDAIMRVCIPACVCVAMGHLRTTLEGCVFLIFFAMLLETIHSFEGELAGNQWCLCIWVFCTCRTAALIISKEMQEPRGQASKEL